MNETRQDQGDGPQRPSPTLVIGLVGGVASGKSSVAHLFEKRGWKVLDADEEARKTVQSPEVLARITAKFGTGILHADGSLDRQRLADLVFADASRRRVLEAITHPAIRASLEAGLAKARAEGTSVVLDVPLLLEAGLVERCDLCVFVEASPTNRLSRAEARGWDEGELARRETHQLSLSMKKNRCAYTIRNDGPIESTDQQVAELLRNLGRQS